MYFFQVSLLMILTALFTAAYFTALDPRRN
jgi:hypothetical protein